MTDDETRRGAIRWLMGVDDARAVARLVGPVEINGDARFAAPVFPH